MVVYICSVCFEPYLTSASLERASGALKTKLSQQVPKLTTKKAVLSNFSPFKGISQLGSTVKNRSGHRAGQFETLILYVDYW